MEFLQVSNDIEIYQRNIQIWLTEVFITAKNLAPPILEDMFDARVSYYSLQKVQRLEPEK